MAPDPIHNPEPSRIEKTPEYGRDKPSVGAGEEAEEPKPFSLPPEQGKEGPASVEGGDKTSPMEVAGEAGQKPWPTEQMQTNMEHLHQQLDDAKGKVQDQKNVLTEDHDKALSSLVDKLNPDYKRIAQNTGQEFHPATRGKGQGVRDYVVNWVNGSQENLTKALNYLSNMKQPDPAAYLKIQMSVQRATQRGELFASIIGSSVSGVKTIMSTQLG